MLSVVHQPDTRLNMKVKPAPTVLAKNLVYLLNLSQIVILAVLIAVAAAANVYPKPAYPEPAYPAPAYPAAYPAKSYDYVSKACYFPIEDWDAN